MTKTELAAFENELLNANYDKLKALAQKAQDRIANAQNVTELKLDICAVWNSISKIVKGFEFLPFVGKYITILADLLDSICNSAKNEKAN